MSLKRFLKMERARLTCEGETVRIVSWSELIKSHTDGSLAHYLADKAPLYYRDVSHVAQSLGDGYFLSAIKETLLRLPNSEWFQQSHFAEIAAAVFAEEVLGLKRLYSKLSILTAENSNAYKMDLVLYDPRRDPLVFVFGEVKSSIKSAQEGQPANHHQSCFRKLIETIGDYENKDLEFDLVSIKDRLPQLPEEDAKRIKESLKPYAQRTVEYAGFAVIDLSTKSDQEAKYLATKECAKKFDVEIIHIEQLADAATAAYQKLEAIRALCSA